jgi:hypothetical protein
MRMRAVIVTLTRLRLTLFGAANKVGNYSKEKRWKSK